MTFSGTDHPDNSSNPKIAKYTTKSSVSLSGDDVITTSFKLLFSDDKLSVFVKKNNKDTIKLQRYV